MATLTVDRFDIGVDVRKSALTTDANRLRECTNAYINNGRSVQKRPGLTVLGAANASTYGLFRGGRKLNTVSNGSTALTHTPAQLLDWPLKPATAFSGDFLWYADFIGNYPFVVCADLGTEVRAFYLDGTGANDEVTNADCPVNKAAPPDPPSCVKLAERIFMNDRELVSYCEVADPMSWTPGVGTADAGNIAAGRQALGSDEVTALGQYQGQLLPMFEDSAQSWSVDADQTLNTFLQSIDGVGCIYPRTVSNLAGDTFFLSANGVRSISLLSLTNNLADVDVGTAIESLLRADLATTTITPHALYNPREGQYCLFLDDGAGNTIVWAYTFSRTAKISAWSRYVFPFNVSYAAVLAGEPYLREDDNDLVLKLDTTAYRDQLTTGPATYADIPVRIQLAFLDMKKPAGLKWCWGCDLSFVGQGVELSFEYEYVDATGERQTATTAAETLNASGSGSTQQSTRPGELIPMDLCVVSISPIIEHSANTDFRLDAITLHYENLGPLS